MLVGTDPCLHRPAAAEGVCSTQAHACTSDGVKGLFTCTCTHMRPCIGVHAHQEGHTPPLQRTGCHCWPACQQLLRQTAIHTTHCIRSETCTLSKWDEALMRCLLLFATRRSCSTEARSCGPKGCSSQGARSPSSQPALTAAQCCCRSTAVAAAQQPTGCWRRALQQCLS